MGRALLGSIALFLLLFQGASLAQISQGEPLAPLTCASCGKPITGKYIQALGRNWHPEHFTCASCQRLLENQVFVPREGRLYCQTCYREQFNPRCSVCGQAMEGRYLEDYWGDRFCQRHRDELDKCFSCQRPICDKLTRGGVRYADGRALCNLCRRTAVDAVGQGAQIALRVRQTLGRMGFDLGEVDIPLRLVDLTELEGAHRHSEPLNGKTRVSVQTRGKQETSRKVEEILVLHGLPQEHYAAVLAHEYGHAYLFLQRFPRLSLQMEEGLCQLLSYQWLEQQGTQEAGFFMQLMRNSQDPVYGAGFQEASKSLGTRSLAELAEYLRQHRRFPPP